MKQSSFETIDAMYILRRQVMMQSLHTPGVKIVDYLMSGQKALVRADTLRGAFQSAVLAVGGKPEKFLSGEGISPEFLDESDGMIPYRSLISLLERSAYELGVPDFGLLLARHTSDTTKVLGPLEIAMKNSETLRDAFSFCAEHVHIYSSAIHMSLERSEWDGREYMLFDVLLDGIGQMRQVVEHALALTNTNIRVISNHQIRASEIWFSHGEPSSKASHAQSFGVPVKFNMPFNAVFFGKGDLDLPIPNRNSMAFRMSASFIDQNYPSPSTSLIRQVRVLIAKQLSTGRATQTTVANMLGMHSRTLQRRLRAEGVSFEAIVDNVRKEITLRNLADKSVLLTEIVERIGYSETSVLTRSCRRWFSQTPTDIRMKSERTGAVH